MLSKYESGQLLPEGYYLRNDTWEVVHIPEVQAEAAGEGEGLKYYRVPLAGILVGGPLVALVWITVFPLLALGFLAYLLASHVAGVVMPPLRSLLERAGLRRRRYDADQILSLVGEEDEPVNTGRGPRAA